MATSDKLAIKVLAQDLAEDAAAYIGVFCDRASTLKMWLLGVKAGSIATLVAGAYYVGQAANWVPGVQPPLWLTGAAWGLLILVAVAILGRWEARAQAYDAAAAQYSQLYFTFTRVARGDCPPSREQASFSQALEQFHKVRGALGCRPISYRELEQSRANFRQ